ncbi:hypothetical protein [Oceanidesulfovibrio marinus]|uniref:Uncharacterized protein n=1 Tax=Oceanidesulfovibrio marinus TaxID=370038 RepID=A0A6P1ZD78_9BACT|nr:hypothetical protein [Oceanidesulfovibrio marinus]TVM31206.1 hypothetical protein DQK91_19035 [Oceanidesulfovibrio marinus]
MSITDGKLLDSEAAEEIAETLRSMGYRVVAPDEPKAELKVEEVLGRILTGIVNHSPNPEGVFVMAIVQDKDPKLNGVIGQSDGEIYIANIFKGLDKTMAQIQEKFGLSTTDVLYLVS